MESQKAAGVEERPPVTETPEFKAIVAERDKARAGAARAAADLDKANRSVGALTKALKDADAEARLKERDALRRQVGDAMSRVAALERERDAARAEADAARRVQAAAIHEALLLRQTVELVQAARDTAQRERAMVAAKALEADARAAALAAELEQARKAPESDKAGKKGAREGPG